MSLYGSRTAGSEVRNGIFFFDETGDTDNRTEIGRDFGGFGSIMKLTTSPDSNTGAIQLFYLGDQGYTGFDNTAFWTKDKAVGVDG